MKLLLYFGFGPRCTDVFMLLTLCFPLSPGVSYSHVQGQTGDEDAAVDTKLYSHRWRRWQPPKPRNMDSNRASQEQDQEPEQGEPEGFPALLSAEDTDNSSQIEVGAGSRRDNRVLSFGATYSVKKCDYDWETYPTA